MIGADRAEGFTRLSDGRGDVMRLECGESIWWQEFQNYAAHLVAG